MTTSTAIVLSLVMIIFSLLILIGSTFNNFLIFAVGMGGFFGTLVGGISGAKK